MSKYLDPDWPVFEIKGAEASPYDLIYEMEPDTDAAGRQYKMVTQTLENNDFYQGLNMITVIERLSDGKQFGYSWWDDISKHGEAYIESNGNEYGLECDTDAEDFDWDTDYTSYFVFEPVHEVSMPIYNYDIYYVGKASLEEVTGWEFERIKDSDHVHSSLNGKCLKNRNGDFCGR